MIDKLDKKIKQYLFNLPHVVGIGHGLKEVGGMPTAESCLVVLVTTKMPVNRLKTKQMVPKSIDGYITDVIEVGHLSAHLMPESESIPEPELIPVPGLIPEPPTVDTEQIDLGDLFQSRTSRIRPAVPGISIGHYLVTAGTFGAVVYDGDGEPVILSNNHVLANASNGTDLRAKLNDPVLQPGPIDGGRVQRNVIAKLVKYVALADTAVNHVDCALAKPLRPELIKPDILGEC